MKAWLIANRSVIGAGVQFCAGKKAVEELKSEIGAKLDAKNVTGYSLDIVNKDAEVTDGKVVGTCDGGTRKIIYKRSAQ